MFYKKNVDICSTKSMWNFLKDHFTYYTHNTWNGRESIANNVKLYKLNLDGDWTVILKYLTDSGDCGCLQDLIEGEIMAFNEEHYPNYTACFNGRSNGYLVLYDTENRESVLPDCVTAYSTYEDFKEDVKAYWNCYKVSDFNDELRDAVELVRDFDRLCDRLRDIVNEYSTRSFNSDKLLDAIERFENEYYGDLDLLDLEGPTMDGDKIRLNDIKDYNAFMHCFFECFGDDRSRIDYNDTHLWLKEV